MLIVWADIGITYFGLSEVRKQAPDVWADAEISMTVSPIIKHFGLEWGMIVSGFVNSLLILIIAIACPIEFAYGVFTGIFILAVAINMRLVIGL